MHWSEYTAAHLHRFNRCISWATRDALLQFVAFASVDDMAAAVVALEHAIALAMVNQSH
jgi:hypothetical protein